MPLYVSQCDKHKTLMDVHLRTIFNHLASVLKRQRDNQYGFGEEENSKERILNNLTEELLNDGDITIEMLSGNLDREIKSSSFKRV